MRRGWRDTTDDGSKMFFLPNDRGFGGVWLRLDAIIINELASRRYHQHRCRPIWCLNCLLRPLLCGDDESCSRFLIAALIFMQIADLPLEVAYRPSLVRVGRA